MRPRSAARVELAVLVQDRALQLAGQTAVGHREIVGEVELEAGAGRDLGREILEAAGDQSGEGAARLHGVNEGRGAGR